MTFLGARPSPMESLYGAFGNPTGEDRRRLYGEQTGVLGSRIQQGQAEAHRAAAASAATAMGGGNPFVAGRLGAQAGGDAAQHVAQQGVVQQAQLSAQQQAQEIAARQQQGQFGQQMIGGLLNAGGQVLGMAVPALGAVRGAAGALGGGGGGGGAGGMLGSLLGGGSQPQPQGASLLGPGGQGIPQQAQPPGPVPPGMRWDPQTNQFVPITGV